MDEPLSRYLSASEAADIDGVMSALTADVEVISPISGRMVFRGRDDVEVLLGPTRWSSSSMPTAASA